MTATVHQPARLGSVMALAGQLERSAAAPKTPRRAGVQATAGMPLPLLLDKLARHGWPGLERRHAVCLRALATRLPHRSAAGIATTAQIADAASYTGRWTRETLAELEDAGVLEWHRGGVRNGKPQPSTFRVVKARLVELLRAGVLEYAQLVARRSAETAARVAGIRASFPRRRRSDHVEVTCNPTPRREVTQAPPAGTAFGQGAPPPGLTAEIRGRLRRPAVFGPA